MREAESHDRLRVLSENLWVGGEGRLDLTAPTALQGPRKLIKEGGVAKAKSGRKLNLVLCNDILVLLDDKSLYRMVSPPVTHAAGTSLNACSPYRCSRWRFGPHHETTRALCSRWTTTEEVTLSRLKPKAREMRGTGST